MKKELIFSKDGRDRNERNLVTVKFFNIMIPEFILDKNSERGFGDRNKSFGILGGINRQVVNKIGLVIIFSDLIPRRGEERKQDFHVRKFAFQTFDNRPALLKLTQGGTMHPDHRTRRRSKVLDQPAKQIFSATNKSFCLGMKERCKSKTDTKYKYGEVVKNDHVVVKIQTFTDSVDLFAARR